MTRQPTTELTCPKCASAMRAYERNGVTIDQCDGCRGIFLDRGELERLIDAESSYYFNQSPRSGQAHRADDPPQTGGHHGDDQREGDEHARYGKRRRGGFLAELFD